MMDLIQYLLLSMGEECAEITQQTSKSMRFGLDDVYPAEPELGTNFDRLQREWNDLNAIVELLGENGVSLELDPETIARKKAKVKKYLDYAVSRKTTKI